MRKQAPLSRHVRRDFLPFGVPTIGDDDRRAVLDVLSSGWIGQGKRCAEFEHNVASYVGVDHGVFVNSATAGLHLSLVALGVGPGDEVITTPMTFVATVNVIEHCGATPVLADIDPATLNISPQEIQKVVTSRTKAVIGIHFAGRSFDIAGTRRAIGDAIPIVEDAAHGIGGRMPGGRKIGASGNLVVFSFGAVKNITTGEGGMILTNDTAVAQRLRIMRLHGLSTDAWERFNSRRLEPSLSVLPGFKYNSTDLNAALGISQLRRLEEFLTRRETIAQRYDRELSEVHGIELLDRSSVDGSRHALHLYIVKASREECGMTRDEFVDALRERNIGAGVHYSAIHLHPFYRNAYGWEPQRFPIALAASQSVLSLPIQPNMTDEDVGDVIEAVRDVAQQRR